MIKDRLNKRIKLSNEMILKIAQIDELKGRWSGSLSLNPKILHQLKKTVIITSSASSTRIEGAKMTDQEVERFLRGIKQKTPKNRDEEEVAGYADLLGRIFDNHKSLKISESGILELHKIMLVFSKKDKEHYGKYKTRDNTVAIIEKGKIKKILFQPTAPWLVKKEMDDLFEWQKERQEKKDLHSLAIIANFIFEFLAIHPFIDGNGRLSRALTNLMMLQNGYGFVPYVSLEEIIEEKQVEYYLSLRKTQKNHKTRNEDITPWLNFFLDAVLAQIEKALNLLEGKENRKLLSGAQEKVYDLFIGGIELKVSEIQKKTKIPMPTVKQSVSRLAEYKMIEKIGQGSATRYRGMK
ncbi:MAG: Fic family protein [Candidatus Pacebacteria bacterium]|nr:Fic family protein [Candidatus Paceibacterota bacterium]